MKREALKNKTVLITGASSGLGAALATESAKAGATVVATGRNVAALQALPVSLKTTPDATGSILPIPADLIQRSAIRSLFAEIDEKCGKINIVINNAALGHNSALAETSEDDIQNIITTNLISAAFVAREALIRMLEQKSGNIAFISSLTGKLAFPHLSVYSASKFGIEGLAEGVREELIGTNTVVTLIRPGIMNTNFFKTASMDEFAHTMLPKMQSPEKVANATLEAIINNKTDVTIGTDRRFMPLLKILPRSLARKLLPFIT